MKWLEIAFSDSNAKARPISLGRLLNHSKPLASTRSRHKPFFPLSIPLRYSC